MSISVIDESGWTYEVTTSTVELRAGELHEGVMYIDSFHDGDFGEFNLEKIRAAYSAKHGHVTIKRIRNQTIEEEV